MSQRLNFPLIPFNGSQELMPNPISQISSQNRYTSCTKFDDVLGSQRHTELVSVLKGIQEEIKAVRVATEKSCGLQGDLEVIARTLTRIEASQIQVSRLLKEKVDTIENSLARSSQIKTIDESQTLIPFDFAAAEKEEPHTLPIAQHAKVSKTVSQKEKKRYSKRIGKKDMCCKTTREVKYTTIEIEQQEEISLCAYFAKARSKKKN